MMIKTVDKRAEKDKIHLYFHLRYVKSPETIAKNEYHKRVSPIVRIGGRSKEIHIPTINIEKTPSEIRVDVNAPILYKAEFLPLPNQAKAAPTQTNTTVRIA
jgi:hypothetical protein